MIIIIIKAFLTFIFIYKDKIKYFIINHFFENENTRIIKNLLGKFQQKLLSIIY